MARAAVASGITTLASTPHLHPDFPDVHVEDLGRRLYHLREALEREQIPLQVVPGAEVSIVWAAAANPMQLALASYGHRRRYLLIETPFVQVPALDRIVMQLQADRYRVILGHPERNAQFQQDDAPLLALVQQGALLQLNADSLLGRFDKRRGPTRLAHQLLVDGVAHVIASDGHRAASWRPVTRLAQAFEVATEWVGPERARWMTQTAPAAIIAGAPLPDPPALRRQPRPRRLFGGRGGG